MKSDEELDGILGISNARQTAEEQLLSLVREQDSSGFTLTMSFSDGRWAISTHDLDSGVHVVGKGNSFTEAWHLQDPIWPDDS